MSDDERASYHQIVDGFSYVEACDEINRLRHEVASLRSALSRFDGIPDDKHLRWASEGTLLSCVTDWLKQIVAQGGVGGMKPNWKDAPEWAKWLALDEDGQWNWFERMPDRFSEFWGGDVCRRKTAQESDEEWKHSLEERPDASHDQEG